MRLVWVLALAEVATACGGTVVDSTHSGPEEHGGTAGAPFVSAGGATAGRGATSSSPSTGGGPASNGGATPSLTGGRTGSSGGAAGTPIIVDGGPGAVTPSTGGSRSSGDASIEDGPTPEGGPTSEGGPADAAVADASRDARPDFCPANIPAPASGPCPVEGGMCAWGFECCHGGCFDSYVCSCVGQRWLCYATDACLGWP